jgi:tetratricopeptide (TPR) repeat protein
MTKAKVRPRFDIDALRDLAGDKSFARGEAYYREGQVIILSIDRARIVAQVAGTEDYRTELRGRGKKIDGECSCPAFEDWGFCKHMVAVALAANEAGDSAGVGAIPRIRDHLKKKGVDTLVDMIIDMAERDLELFRRLDTAAALHADDKTLETRLRKSIDEATRTRSFVDYRNVPRWAKGVDSALDAVAGLAAGERAGLALKLAEHAIERIESAVAAIDDSDGHGGALLHRAHEIHLAAARAARPEPVALARGLFAREMESEHDTFDGAAEAYAAVLGKKGLAEYRRLAVEAWETLPSLSRPIRERHEPPGRYDRLKGILDVFAEREGDVEARIALRTKDLSSSWRYFQLAEFCRAQGRDAEALRRAEEGLWLFEDERPDGRLVSLVAELLANAGRKSDAVAHLIRTFEKEPSLELYARLRKMGGKPACQRAVEFLEGRLVQKKPVPGRHLADILIRILMSEKMFDAAWTVMYGHGATMVTKEQLARASETTHPHEALAVYVKRVEELVNAGGNPAYADAAKLVGRMVALQSATEQNAYVATIKERFGRRRNFVKLLG